MRRCRRGCSSICWLNSKFFRGLDNLDSSRFGVIEREGKKAARYRAKD